MERYENFNSERARSLGIAQIVFTVLTLILGIIQANAFLPWCVIAPIISSVFQIAPTACGMLAAEEKNKGFNITCAILMLFGLALFIINIWAATLGYVSCSGSQTRVGPYPGGHMMMQPTYGHAPAPGMQNYPHAPGSGMQGYPQAPGIGMQGYPYPQQYAPAPGTGIQGYAPAPGLGAQGYAHAQANPTSGSGVRETPIQSA